MNNNNHIITVINMGEIYQGAGNLAPTMVITCRLPLDLWRNIQREANEENKLISEVVRDLLREEYGD